MYRNNSFIVNKKKILIKTFDLVNKKDCALSSSDNIKYTYIADKSIPNGQKWKQDLTKIYF